VWAFVAAVGLARVARGLWRVRSLKKSCVPIDKSEIERLVTPATTRRIAICVSERLRVPAALGFFRPVIALPSWTLRELSDEELSAVIIHEAAHLERWDDWTNLIQKVIRALLFFHPAVWWIDNRLSMEREMSCDDVVLSRSQNAHRYAACLVSLAEKTHAHRSLALVQAAVSHVKHTAQRISKILDGRQRRVAPVFKPAFAALMAFGAITMVAVQHTPQLVSFRGDETSKSASAGKFDYVATVNQAAGNVIAASWHPANSAPARQYQPKRGAVKRRAVTPRVQHNADRMPLPTEEARQQPESRGAAFVNAAMNDATQPHFVYVITQSEQYDSFGNVTVTTSVWRIRVASPAPGSPQNAGFPHQT
jgi:hypothetical protein